MNMSTDGQKYALLSVFSKEGIDLFAATLIEFGFKIISSGGTKKYLSEKGVPAIDVAEITGMPAILDHRLVTEHHKIIGGLVSRDCKEHDADREKYDIPWIDLLCVDLYPLADAIREGKSDEEILEKVDVGGPNMLAAASKGRRIVVCDPVDRQDVLDWLKNNCPDRNKVLQRLAAKADFIVTEHRLLSARYFSNGEFDGMLGTRVAECKGENGSQQAARYSSNTDNPFALDRFKLLEGAPLSYINWCDMDRISKTVVTIACMFDGGEVSPKIAIGGKHGNPCGASIGFAEKDKKDVIAEMVDGDSLSISGGTVITNFTIDNNCASLLVHHMSGSTKRILDVVIAPNFTDKARDILRRKDGRCRMFINPALDDGELMVENTDKHMRCVNGGFLLQDGYSVISKWWEHPELECHGDLTPNMIQDLTLACAIGSRSNSNTITVVNKGKLIGNGTGQQSRLYAADLAIERARKSGHEFKKASCYSDSFFSHTDGPQTLITAGITAVFATRKGIRYNDVVSVFEEAGVVFVTLPDDIARGFFGH